MGSEEKIEKVMWYVVYRELAELLAETNGETLYEKCFSKEFRDDFIELHNWAKKSENKKIINARTGENFEVNSFDPMQIFASFNSLGMKGSNKIERIKLYFKILGSNLKCERIDFKGCPTQMIISLVANRNPETQEELWKVFYSIIKKRKNAKVDF